MSFKVVWTETADEELGIVWNEATDRDVVTQAAITIDRLLTANAATVGESREDGQRIVLVPPLGVMCQFSDDGRTVFVSRVWRFRTD